MRFSVALSLFVVIVTSNAAYADPEMPASKLADTAGCPSTMAFETTNGEDYALAFDAPAKLTASFVVHAYGSTDDYTASLPNVAVETPWTRDDGAKRFRSAGMDLLKPDGSTIVAASVVATIAGKACPAESVFVPDAKAFLAAQRSPNQRTVDNAIAADIGSGDTNIPFAKAPATSFPCSTPFAKSLLLIAQRVEFPEAAKRTGAIGTTQVLVSIGATGVVSDAAVYASSGSSDLDDATLKAARASTYAVSKFACVAQASQQMFIADFSAKVVPLSGSNNR